MREGTILRHKPTEDDLEDQERKKLMYNLWFPAYLSKKTVKFFSMILKRNPEYRVGIQELLECPDFVFMGSIQSS